MQDTRPMYKNPLCFYTLTMKLQKKNEKKFFCNCNQMNKIPRNRLTKDVRDLYGENYAGASNLGSAGHVQLRTAMTAARCKIVNLLETLWIFFFWWCVTMYLVCGPRQLFFFQSGPEMPKVWTPLLQRIVKRDWKSRNEVERYFLFMGWKNQHI